MIGETVIDIEDRYFSALWLSQKDKPIEFRSLYHPSSSVEQGKVKMWLEIHSQADNPHAQRVWDLKTRAASVLISQITCRITKSVLLYGALMALPLMIGKAQVIFISKLFHKMIQNTLKKQIATTDVKTEK